VVGVVTPFNLDSRFTEELTSDVIHGRTQRGGGSGVCKHFF